MSDFCPHSAAPQETSSMLLNSIDVIRKSTFTSDFHNTKYDQLSKGYRQDRCAFKRNLASDFCPHSTASQETSSMLLNSIDIMRKSTFTLDLHNSTDGQ